MSLSKRLRAELLSRTFGGWVNPKASPNRLHLKLALPLQRREDVSNFELSVILICFGFRILDFEFNHSLQGYVHIRYRPLPLQYISRGPIPAFQSGGDSPQKKGRKGLIAHHEKPADRGANQFPWGSVPAVFIVPGPAGHRSLAPAPLLFKGQGGGHIQGFNGPGQTGDDFFRFLGQGPAQRQLVLPVVGRRRRRPGRKHVKCP